MKFLSIPKKPSISNPQQELRFLRIFFVIILLPTIVGITILSANIYKKASFLSSLQQLPIISGTLKNIPEMTPALWRGNIIGPSHRKTPSGTSAAVYHSWVSYEVIHSKRNQTRIYSTQQEVDSLLLKIGTSQLPIFMPSTAPQLINSVAGEYPGSQYSSLIFLLPNQTLASSEIPSLMMPEKPLNKAIYHEVIIGQHTEVEVLGCKWGKVLVKCANYPLSISTTNIQGVYKGLIKQHVRAVFIILAVFLLLAAIIGLAYSEKIEKAKKTAA